VSLLPICGLLGPVNALDEGKGEWTEEVLSELFFSRDGGGPADERSKARSRSSSAGKHCSTVRSTLGAFGCACGIGDGDGRQLVEVDGAGDGPCDDNRGGGEGQGELPADVYDVPMPGTAKLAEEDFRSDPPPLVPVLAF